MPEVQKPLNSKILLRGGVDWFYCVIVVDPCVQCEQSFPNSFLSIFVALFSFFDARALAVGYLNSQTRSANIIGQWPALNLLFGEEKKHPPATWKYEVFLKPGTTCSTWHNAASALYLIHSSQAQPHDNLIKSVQHDLLWQLFFSN